MSFYDIVFPEIFVKFALFDDFARCISELTYLQNVSFVFVTID